MIKFYKEDIKYIKRTAWAGFNYIHEYQYHFSVRSESANYLDENEQNPAKSSV